MSATALHGSAGRASNASKPRAGYADGAPAGFSGGFGEPTCHACHFQAEPDSGPGRVAITGLPPRFVPGESYRVTVTLTSPRLLAGGFQLTARLVDGGGQAGALAPAPGQTGRLAIETHGGVQYANQRRPGTPPVEADTATWELIWTAPATPHAVVFNVSANAADKDETAGGDYVYTVTRSITPLSR